MRMGVAALLASFAWTTTAHSQPARQTTTCASPKGQSVILDEGERGRWIEDGMTGGSVTVLRAASGEHDVEIRFGTDRFTAREDGASVARAPGSTERAFTLTATYPLGTVETYAFSLDVAGRGSLVWTIIKRQPAGGVRGSVFEATCRPAG